VKVKHNTLTVEVTPQINDELVAVSETVPLATRHAIARAALLVGLRDLAGRKPAEIVKVLVNLRRSRREEATQP